MAEIEASGVVRRKLFESRRNGVSCCPPADVYIEHVVRGQGDVVECKVVRIECDKHAQ